MRQDDIADYLGKDPFQPFRIHLSTGAFFDIRNPQMAASGRSALTIALALEENKQRFVVVALVHIAWLEILLPSP